MHPDHAAVGRHGWKLKIRNQCPIRDLLPIEFSGGFSIVFSDQLQKVQPNAFFNASLNDCRCAGINKREVTLHIRSINCVAGTIDHVPITLLRLDQGPFHEFTFGGFGLQPVVCLAQFGRSLIDFRFQLLMRFS